MSMFQRVAAISLAVAVCMSASASTAQVVARSYTKGPVTLVTRYNLAPGKLNTFMQDYTTNVRVGYEAAKKTGVILSYGVSTPITRGPGEPNLYTTIVFKDLASYDRSYAAADAAAVATYGSLEKAGQAAAKRAEYATVVSSSLLQGMIPN